MTDTTLPPQEELIEAARQVVRSYDAANPMRTADVHSQPCDCMRCARDNLSACLQACKGDGQPPEES